MGVLLRVRCRGVATHSGMSTTEQSIETSCWTALLAATGMRLDVDRVSPAAISRRLIDRTSMSAGPGPSVSRPWHSGSIALRRCVPGLPGKTLPTLARADCAKGGTQPPSAFAWCGIDSWSAYLPREGPHALTLGTA
jgi:hypothetical protein